MKYNPALDGLRAWAVGLVVFAHMPAVQGVDFMFTVHRFAEGLRVGYLGVDIFFVLSGFLVTRILLNDKAEGRFSFARFYAKRTLRIFPIFYLSLAFCAVVFPLPVAEIVSNGFYVSNYYYVFHDQSSPLRHTWSLSVEEQFYLVWPLVLYCLPLRRVGLGLLIGVPVVVIASLAISHALMADEQFSRLVVRGAMFRILSLGAGAVLAYYVAKLQDFRLSAVIVAGLMALFGHIASVLQEGPWRPVLGLFSMSLLAISIFCAAYIGFQRRHLYSRWLLEWRPIVYLGKISYGIYLYHFIILHALDARGSENPLGVPLLTWLAFLALSLAVPAISYHFIESPLLRLKERLNERPADGQAARRAAVSGTGPELPQVLYIAGYGRSGSTLLSRLLGQQPEICNAGELVSIVRWIDSPRPCSCGAAIADCPLWGRVRPSISRLPRERWQAIIDSGLTLIFGHWWIPGHERAFYRGRQRRLFAEIARASGAGIVVDGSKSAWPIAGRARALRLIAGLDIRVVHLVRAPQAVRESLQRGTNKELEGRRASARPFRRLRAFMGWSAGNAAARCLTRRHFANRSLLLRYEQLTANPDTAIGALESFLGQRLDRTRDTLHLGRETVVQHVAEGNRMRLGPLRLLPAAPVDASAIDRLLCATCCGPLCRVLGYTWGGGLRTFDPERHE